ncbi:MAG: hypothetical protein M4579_003017 [Chaenotheca gracillima]|nr:MAG: hypothetical protein M4579_003017 [Chaenotheca gracillima]
MDRRWDNPASASTSPLHASQPHTLPGINDLAKGVPANGHPADSPTYQINGSVRDSGNWSMPTNSKRESTDPSYEHHAHLSADSSVISSAASGLHLPSIASQRPSSNANYSTTSGERSPFSASFTNGPTSAAEHHPSGGLNQINQPFDFNQPPKRDEFPQESRRSSIASGVGHLAIQSPLASNNASQTSLANNLQRERGIHASEAPRNGTIFSNGVPRSGTLGNPATPMGARRVQRTAPPINTNPRSEAFNPYADAPTKGHPYAFPDPEMSKNMGPTEEERATSSHRSRRDSIGANSISSSIFTSDSRLPSVQHRLEDDHSSPNDDDGMSYYPPRSTSDLNVSHHHHQLQHKQLSGLIGPPDSPSGGTPYSRTPELRVSHKLAERKRRSEMKGLFDELRAHIPSDNRTSKTSKWEILTKAVEHIKGLTAAWEASQKHCDIYQEQANRAFMLQQENKELRAELERLHTEIEHVRQQSGAPNVHYHQNNHSNHPNAPPPPPPQQQQQQQQQQPGPPQSSVSSHHPPPQQRVTLPVPMTGHAPSQAPPSGPMQGIQYSA